METREPYIFLAPRSFADRQREEIILEKIERLLKLIHTTVEIVREHLETRAYRNHLTTGGIESIISSVDSMLASRILLCTSSISTAIR